MEAQTSHPPDPEPPVEDDDDPSQAVADSTAPAHFEGKGLNPEIEERHAND